MKNEPDLFVKIEPPKPIIRLDKKMPIIVDRDRDEIEERNIYEGNRRAGCPKVILNIARRSKNAIIAWTGAIGWCVFAENEMTEERAYYFREDVDDPNLSYRCMTGQEP